ETITARLTCRRTCPPARQHYGVNNDGPINQSPARTRPNLFCFFPAAARNESMRPVFYGYDLHLHEASGFSAREIHGRQTRRHQSVVGPLISRGGLSHIVECAAKRQRGESLEEPLGRSSESRRSLRRFRQQELDRSAQKSAGRDGHHRRAGLSQSREATRVRRVSQLPAGCVSQRDRDVG